MKVIYVNGQRVDPAEVTEQLMRFDDGYRQQLAESMEPDAVAAQLAQDALDNVIDDMLLTQAAGKSNPTVSDREVKQRLSELKRDAGGAQALYERLGLSRTDEPLIRDRIRTQLRVNRYLDKLGRDAPRPSDDACRELYDHDPESFAIPEMILASEIVQEPDRGRSSSLVFADMMNIRQAILDGADFGEVAKMVSGKPDNDGNLGYFPRGNRDPAFERVAFELEEGEVSEVFQVDCSYCLVKVFGRRPREARDFESVRELIRDTLWGVRKNQRIGQEADALRKAANIRVKEDST